MNTEDIIRMAANEYGIYAFTAESLEHFAALVAAPLEEEIKRLRFCIPEGDAAAAMEYLAYCVEKAVAEEREAILKLTDSLGWIDSAAIRARGEK